MIENFKNQIKNKTDQELKDIFVKYDNYSPVFLELTAEELRYRNISTNELIDERTKYIDERNDKLSIGEKGSVFWINVGYIAAILGGVFSIFLGYSYAFSKKKNYEGEDFFVYDEATRKSGRSMLYIGISVFIFFFIYNYYKY